MIAFLNRVYSQVYKNILVMWRNYFRLFDVTVWPLIPLFSITLFVNFVQGDASIVAMVILGVTGWRAVYHMQIDMTTSYMEEYWSHSLNHFLISPLRMVEFILGNIITGLLKFFFVLALYLIIGKLIFAFSIANMWLFVLGIFSLSIFGIAIGMLSMGIIIIYHENAYTASYIIPDLLVLLSGVYYPISIFPEAVQSIVKFIPAVYGFDILKSIIGLAEVNYAMLIATTLIWLAASLLFFSACYRYARKNGKLGRMS